MEAQAALVGADGAVELHAVALVDVHAALVVHPRNAEEDDALGLDETFEERCLLVLGMALDDGTKAVQDLGRRLMELGFVGVLLLELFKHSLYIIHKKYSFACG